MNKCHFTKIKQFFIQDARNESDQLNPLSYMYIEPCERTSQEYLSISLK